MEDRAYEVAINSKYDGYQKALRGMVYTFFDKKTGSGVNLSIHKQLDQELRKPVTKIFKRRRVCYLLKIEMLKFYYYVW